MSRRLRVVVRADHGAPTVMMEKYRALALRYERSDALRRRTERELRSTRRLLRDLADRQHGIRHEERARIARELHDEMGQLLSALRFDVEALEHGLGRRAAGGSGAAMLERAVDASALVRQMVESLRRVVAGGRPAALERLDLWAALREECRRLQARTGIACVVLTPGAPASFGEVVDAALFRIAQEAVTNAVRHGRPSHVTLTFEVRRREVVLRVEDDGRGIVRRAAARTSGGIAGMRERARQLGGELSVRRRAPRGTVASARIPLVGPDRTIGNFPYRRDE
ncbi:MAG TPA: ATP-binding protein [Anaeromyxobacteraceae bacterium]|nr:ATP-binding protein [Anaeromyxobacteraceae bacterium]